MNIRHANLASLEQAGDAQMKARDPEAAARLYAEAADLSEIPPGGLLVKLARAHLKAGHPDQAAGRLLSVADTAMDFRTWTAAAGLLERCPVEHWPGVRRKLQLGLVATWTTSAFAPLLRLAAARLGIALTLHEPDFGQYFNETLNPESALLARGVEALVLAPEHRALGLRPFTETPEADADGEIARWGGVWEAVRRRAKPLIVQMGFAHPGSDPLGHYAAGLPGTRARVVGAINRGLAERAAAADVGFLDTAMLAGRHGDGWFDDRGWYLAKMPYAPDALPVLARHTAAVLAARLGLSRRAVVLDLDNTLWGGVIGDDGLAGITLGGGAAGEAFVDFQVALKELVGRGIVLAVASKNDPEVALAPFREHPEMVLKEEDIAAFVANWGPKSESIVRIAETLGLGLESLTFLDDNPYERAQVRRALPEVDVPVLPEDPAGYRQALESYPHFEPATFTTADRDRAGQYRARAQAIAVQAAAGSLEEYQASLNMAAQFGAIDALNMARVVQLINKTNQFNLTTRRRNQAEVEALLAAPGTLGFWVRLSDKFADHGLIAVVIAAPAGAALEIDTLLMSCRVLGRGVEALILAELARLALEAGKSQVLGRYEASARNGMVADLYPRLGFDAVAGAPEGETRWTADAAALTAPGVPIQVTWA